MGVEAQQKVREAENGACALAIAAPNGFRQGVVRSVREGVAVNPLAKGDPRAWAERCSPHDFAVYPQCQSDGSISCFAARPSSRGHRMAASVSRGSAMADYCIPKFHPYRRMVASALHSAGMAVKVSLLRTRSIIVRDPSVSLADGFRYIV